MSTLSTFTGQILGNYRLYEPIGSGGMAVVYRAEQLTIQRIVAIKVLSSALAIDPEFVARFRREAATAARLEHPNIVPVYDFGAQAETLYVVMRYLPGGSLAQRVKRFGIPGLADTAHLISEIASALDYAHKNGVIHRDIKPANILLDEEGRAFLADFGIARLLNSAGTTVTTGIGTPAYMAPEQFVGQHVDARTDVYSLGVMLYVMATGKLPFEADSQMGVAYQHINTPPVPPVELKSEIPPTVSDVILKALAKSPIDRPATPGALAASFAEALAEGQSEPTVRSTYFVQPLPPVASAILEKEGNTAPSSHPSPVAPVLQAPEGNSPLLLDTRPRSGRTQAGLTIPLVAGLVVSLVAVALVVAIAGIQLLRSGLRTPTAIAANATSSATGQVEPTASANTIPSTNTVEPRGTAPSVQSSTASAGVVTSTLVPIRVSPTPSMTPTIIPTGSAPGVTRMEDSGIVQVWVPAGCFMMGSDPAQDPTAQPDEMPQHQVCISQGFWLDQYEVTNAAFQAFIDAGGYHRPEFWSTDGWQWVQSKGITGPLDLFGATKPQQPRVGISWYEAEAYAHWRGARLPTEAEWEYAARGPDSRIYPWGNTYQSGYANFDEQSTGGPHAGQSAPVGSYENGKSWVKAYDMAGNVWEWVNDWYDANYYQQRIVGDPQGPLSGTTRSLRGGSWFNDPSCARAACRHVRFRGRSPDSRDDAVGVRLVVDATQPDANPDGSTARLDSTEAPCTGLRPPRLAIGKHGRVSPGDPNRLRDEPGGKIIGRIPAEGVFTVLAGPRCTADGMAWWKVDYQGQTGWTAEGSADYYWLEPWSP